MPKQVYRIKLSDKDTALNGKSIREIVEEANAKESNKKNPLTEKDVISMEMAEKGFFEAALQQAMKSHKKLADFNVITDLAQTIDSAEAYFDIDESDLDTYILKSIEAMEPNPLWIRLSGLFAQLKSPSPAKEKDEGAATQEEPKE